MDAVGLRDLVTRLGGYHAQLVPTVLSAGERQLIALARAYLSPARLAILDEATSHLDPAAAAHAERAFAARPGTLIVIAHRMSSALRADGCSSWMVPVPGSAITPRSWPPHRCTGISSATGRLITRWYRIRDSRLPAADQGRSCVNQCGGHGVPLVRPGELRVRL